MQKKVYVIGGNRYQEARLIAEWGWLTANNMEEADVVVFTGGADVDPALYNQRPHNTTQFTEWRDRAEITAFQRAHALEIPMFGICRGAQLLTVLTGGHLVQDISGHGTDHPIVDLDTGETFEVTSCHHQMMVPAEDAIIRAVSPMEINAKLHNTKDGLFYPHRLKDIPEVVIFPAIRGLGVQGHPEFSIYDAKFARFRDYCKALLTEVIEGKYKTPTPAVKNAAVPV